MDIFAQLAEKIIKEQESIIGPVAFEQAKNVSGLEVNASGKIAINGNGKTVIADLIKQYEKLFGQTSVEVCKEAVRDIKTKIAKDELPAVLQ